MGKAVNSPSFDEIAEVISELTGVDKSRITPASRLEHDLGVTGDDGVQLLETLAKKYRVDFDRPNHGGRYLFGSDSFDPISPILRRILGRSPKTVIPITVGDLHLAAARGRWEGSTVARNLVSL
jgi:acyl carrier protein